MKAEEDVGPLEVGRLTRTLFDVLELAVLDLARPKLQGGRRHDAVVAGEGLVSGAPAENVDEELPVIGRDDLELDMNAPRLFTPSASPPRHS